ncbi:MAG: ATP synthase F1 subunit delta [Eubacteriales bacterium]|nr:ATP synthase F1 subunit delta [Eubacteriales bacterium]
MAKLVQNVYGDALFNFALENNSLEKMYEESIDVINVFTVSNDLMDFLNNPIISLEEKKKAIKELFLDRIWGNVLSNAYHLFNLDKIEKFKQFKSMIDSKVRLIKGKGTSILDFLFLLLDKRRHNDIVPTLQYFNARVKEYLNIGVAEVSSAEELSDAQKKQIEEKLIATTKYEKFEITYAINTQLIAGLRIKVGDKVLDSSIENKINNISKNLRGVRL